MGFQIRSAVSSDRWAIRQIVWRARINPFDLDWRRFLVAEQDGKLIGVGQVKPHRDGIRELASIVVAPSQQGNGVGSALVRALLTCEQGPLYLICRVSLESYYARFGFTRISFAVMPVEFRQMKEAAQLVQTFAPFWKERLIFRVMRLD